VKKTHHLYSAELDSLKQKSRLRSLTTNKGIDFSGNDYLSLSTHPVIKQKLIEALESGISQGSTGSRLLRGNHPVFEEFESYVSDWKKVESTLIFNSGFDANVGILTTLIPENALVFSDQFIHASMIDGLKQNPAKKERFRHCNYDHLETLLKKHETDSSPKFIVVESVYSMDGDITDFKSVRFLCEKYGAELIVDEAHAIGMFGNSGAGILEENDMMEFPLATVHTCGKALGSFGAFVTCRSEVKDYLVNKCRTLIFTTALSPLNVIATQAAIELQKTMKDERNHVLNLSDYFRSGIQKSGKYETGNSKSMIVPVMIGTDEDAIHLSEKCKSENLDARAIRPPSVPENTSRLRITFNSSHKINDVDKLLDILS